MQAYTTPNEALGIIKGNRIIQLYE
jgi:hypothetical protein